MLSLPPPISILRRQYTPLDLEKAKVLRSVMKNVRLVIIDEFSMVSNTMLAIIHKRLQEVQLDGVVCTTVEVPDLSRLLADRVPR